ncbi:T9SS type A sorting domain-containing protein [bacterium]|nr:T9SS type A sorting domain-containing protein [bacterium]
MNTKKFSLVCLFVFLYMIKFLDAQQVAFPGAEGFGAYTTGGRGGSVYIVTNLNDSGAGSLRDAVSQSHRTVVFQVSGTIHLQSALKITGSSVTVAGQTAPGDGICVRDYPTIVEGNHVIVRYMRFRLGDTTNLSSDAFNINDRENVIIDHCSISWGGDECASWYGNKNVTIQWCMIGEGLNYLGHSMGGLWGGSSTYHHNLIHSCGSRHPKFAYTYDGDITDHRNNVIYNWDYQSAYCSPTGRVNIVANYYKSGPATNPGVRHRIVYSEYNTKRLHVAGNEVFGYPEITEDNWNGGVDGTPIRHDAPFAAPPVSQQDPETACELVLTHSGASLHRDSADSRVVDQVREGTGQIIDRPGDAGGFPVLNALSPPADSDLDGMPDAYETAHSLDPDDPEDRNLDPDNDGFTNLEDYLNGLIPFEYEGLGNDTEPPATPSDLQASTFSGSQIDLTWTDNATNERGFRIQYSDDGWQTVQEITQALANIMDYSVSGLSGSTLYEFKVAAYNMAGNSAYSAVASDSTIADNHFFLRTRVDGPGRIVRDPEDDNFPAGTAVTLTAVPDSGYVFDTWLDDLSGVQNPYGVTITTTITVTAKFAEKAENVPLLFDFGPGPVADGYTQITNTTSAYTVGTGYGFTDISGLDVRDRGAPDILKRDFVVANTPRSFIVDLPDDTYRIHVTAGDAMSSAPNGPMDVFAEGDKKIAGMFSEGGQFDQRDFLVEILDGQLNLDIVHSNSSSGTWRLNSLEIRSTTADIACFPLTPAEFGLLQNYPNPFNSVTTIRYTMPRHDHARLGVYDTLGKEIDVLVDKDQNPGVHTVRFDARDLSSGIYFYVLRTTAFCTTKKLILIK